MVSGSGNLKFATFFDLEKCSNFDDFFDPKKCTFPTSKLLKFGRQTWVGSRSEKSTLGSSESTVRGTVETGGPGAKGTRARLGGGNRATRDPGNHGFPGPGKSGNRGFPTHPSDPSDPLQNASFPVWGQTSATQRGPGIVKKANSISRLKMPLKVHFFDFSGIPGNRGTLTFRGFPGVGRARPTPRFGRVGRVGTGPSDPSKPTVWTVVQTVGLDDGRGGGNQGFPTRPDPGLEVSGTRFRRPPNLLIFRPGKVNFSGSENGHFSTSKSAQTLSLFRPEKCQLLRFRNLKFGRSKRSGPISSHEK